MINKKNINHKIKYNNEEDFAVLLNTKNGDQIILAKRIEANNFEEIYKEINKRKEKFDGEKKLGSLDSLSVPNLNMDLFREYREIIGKPFKTKELSSQINSARLSFASAEDMEKYLDIHPGAVSVMGLMNDHDNAVQLLVDEDVLRDEYFGCHPCVNTSSLKLKTEEVFTKYLDAVHHNYMTVTLKGDV